MSPLCSRVADDLYEMDSEVRNLLLRRLVDDWRFGEQRLIRLSKFMSAYINIQKLEDPRIDQDLGLEPQWMALAYASPKDRNLEYSTSQYPELLLGFSPQLLPRLLDSKERLCNPELLLGFIALRKKVRTVEISANPFTAYSEPPAPSMSA